MKTRQQLTEREAALLAEIKDNRDRIAHFASYYRRHQTFLYSPEINACIYRLRNLYINLNQVRQKIRTVGLV